MKPHAHILDLGCGSGRDSKAFLQQGYKVTAMDGSQVLCQLASETIGQLESRIRSYWDGFLGHIWPMRNLALTLHDGTWINSDSGKTLFELYVTEGSVITAHW